LWANKVVFSRQVQSSFLDYETSPFWARKTPFLGRKIALSGQEKRLFLGKKSSFDGMISPCLGKKIALFGQLNRPLWASNSPLVGKKVALFWARILSFFGQENGWHLCCQEVKLH